MKDKTTKSQKDRIKQIGEKIKRENRKKNKKQKKR